MPTNQNFLGSFAPDLGGGLGDFGSLADFGSSPLSLGGGGGGGNPLSGLFGGGDIPFLGNVGSGGGIGGAAKNILSHHPILDGLFGGGDDKPKKPYWQRLANREYAQGYAVLNAYNRLYQPTLEMAQRSASDYGDLYRRAANEALSHNTQSASATRTADLADYSRLAPEYYQAVRGFDPQATGVRDTLYNTIQDDASRLNDPMSSAAAREITQASLGQSALRGFGTSARDAAQAYVSTGLTGEQLSSQRRSQLFDAALKFLGANQQAFGDTFQAITGRPSMPQPQGANIMAPKVGTDYDDLLSYGINREIQGRNLSAANSAANKAMIGQIISGLLSGAGGAAAGICWVAREVFGEESPKWVAFRNWLLCCAPPWFAQLYVLCGPDYAAYLRANPEAKPPVRQWMEDRIAEMNN